jgi:hypothetical protein
MWRGVVRGRTHLRADKRAEILAQAGIGRAIVRRVQALHEPAWDAVSVRPQRARNDGPLYMWSSSELEVAWEPVPNEKFSTPRSASGGCQNQAVLSVAAVTAFTILCAISHLRMRRRSQTHRSFHVLALFASTVARTARPSMYIAVAYGRSGVFGGLRLHPVTSELTLGARTEPRVPNSMTRFVLRSSMTSDRNFADSTAASVYVVLCVSSARCAESLHVVSAACATQRTRLTTGKHCIRALQWAQTSP